MKKTMLIITVAFYALLISSCKKSGPTIPPNDIVESTPHLLATHTVNISTNIQGYYSGLPANYSSTTKKYPVIIWLPGGGQFGNGSAAALNVILNDGIPKLIFAKTFPPTFYSNNVPYSFILIAPQFTQTPVLDDIRKIINHTYENYRVDSSRVYMCGISLGGGFTAESAVAWPNEISAIVTMGGTILNYNNTVEYNAKAKAMADNKMPVWSFHNDGDPVNPVSESTTFAAAVNSYSPAIPVKYTQFTANMHDCWTKATNPDYKENNMNIYEWLLQYKK